METSNLPAPLYKNYEWQERAKCRGTDSELFFLPYKARNAEKRNRIIEAKKVCSGCPVIGECLTYALDTQQEFGVWGGMSEDERKVILRRKKVTL